MERLVTTSQAAEILGLSLQGIHYRIKKNQLKSLKKDGKTFKTPHLEEQGEMMKLLTSKGYAIAFTIGFSDAKRIIDNYLKL